jgi:hypothetical protein
MKHFPMKHLYPFAVLSVLLTAACQQKTVVFLNDSEEADAVAESAGRVALPEVVSFNEHIQPILSEYCYH